MLRIFDGIGEPLASQQHVDGDIAGAVLVIINESADQQAAVATLRQIAALLEAEEVKVAATEQKEE
jgi:hypothetical protein